MSVQFSDMPGSRGWYALYPENKVYSSLDFNTSLSVGAMCCGERHLVVYGQTTKLDTKLRET